LKIYTLLWIFQNSHTVTRCMEETCFYDDWQLQVKPLIVL